MNGSEEPFFGGRHHKILQVEGLEIGDILRPSGLERRLRQADQTSRRGGHLNERRARQHVGALAGAVAEDNERPVTSTVLRKTFGSDHLGRDPAQCLPPHIEELRVDLHAAGVDHRAEHGILPVLDRDDARLVVLARHFGQGVERPDGQQRLLQPVAEPLGLKNHNCHH